MIAAAWLILACGAPKDGAGADSADSAEVLEAPAPLGWEGCALLYAPGTLGEADERMAFAPAPLEDRLWFAVRGQTGPQRVASATLVAGEHGPALEDPAVAVEPDELPLIRDASSPSPIRAEDGSLNLYFDAIDDEGRLGLWRCDSDDDRSWRDCAAVLLPGAEGVADAAAAQIPRVLDMGDHLRLWYTGIDELGMRRILTARSTDGWTWEEARVAVDFGTQGDWDANSVYSAFVWPDAGGYRMLYTGRATWEGYDVKRLIEAWSPDALVWTGFAEAMDLGCAGAEDAWRVDSAWVVPEGEGWRLYYDGFDDPLTDVGNRTLLTAVSGG